MAKVKVGFVGVGGMGQCAHLRNYVLVEDCEVVAIAEVKKQLGQKVARAYNIPRVYDDHAAMLKAEKLDAVVASQPFGRHGQLLPTLLAANLPVFSEKPIASSIAVGEQIVAAAKASKGFLMVGYHKRSDPATMYAKKVIDELKASGELGALRYVRITMPPGDWVAGGFKTLIRSDDPNPQLAWDPPAPDMDEETFKKYTGFVNYYIHQVNLLRHLLGEPYKAAYADPSGVLLVAQSAGGVAGLIEMAPYNTTVDWNESALIGFEHGYVSLELPAPLACNRAGRVKIMRDPGKGRTPETVIPQMPWTHAMEQQARNFIAAVRRERPPMCDAAEALEDLRVARDYIRLLTGV